MITAEACPSGRSPTLAVPGTGRPGEPEASRRDAEIAQKSVGARRAVRPSQG